MGICFGGEVLPIRLECNVLKKRSTVKQVLRRKVKKGVLDYRVTLVRLTAVIVEG